QLIPLVGILLIMEKHQFRFSLIVFGSSIGQDLSVGSVYHFGYLCYFFPSMMERNAIFDIFGPEYKFHILRKFRRTLKLKAGDTDQLPSFIKAVTKIIV